MNKKIFTTTITIYTLLICSANTVLATVSDQLLLYIPFNEDVSDHSVNNFDVTINGGGLTIKDGIIGKCAEFDGVDDWIQIKNDGKLNFNASNQNFSLSFWFFTDCYRTENHSEQTILMDRYNSNNKHSYNFTIKNPVFDFCSMNCSADQRGRRIYNFVTNSWCGSYNTPLLSHII
ncbi:conserved hypothetical protein, secreted [Candidatus Magnetomorum sp. HK-1]|nr:conserved hypothetical protein, secreted [Candidatus Magnetomorum sp. HK-1]